MYAKKYSFSRNVSQTQINSGNGTYVHLQFETPARVTPPQPDLVACFIDQRAQTPLMQLDISSIDNLCYTPRKRVKSDTGEQKSSAYRLRQAYGSVFVASMIGLISIVVVRCE